MAALKRRPAMDMELELTTHDSADICIFLGGSILDLVHLLVSIFFAEWYDGIWRMMGKASVLGKARKSFGEMAD